MSTDRYQSFRDLQAKEVEGNDYCRTVVRKVEASIAVVAPHGGKIEHHTSSVAKEIAGEDYRLYLFEGIKNSGNYSALHIASHRFDDPECVRLVSDCESVVSIHGCKGTTEEALLGGLDEKLISLIAKELSASHIQVKTSGHPFPGKEPSNICNRGVNGKGVQIELSDALRRSGSLARVAPAVRAALGRRVEA